MKSFVRIPLRQSPTLPRVCKSASFPCTVSLEILAGLAAACKACKPHMQKARIGWGWYPLTGESKGFWMSGNITEGQQSELLERILKSTQANIPDGPKNRAKKG